MDAQKTRKDSQRIATKLGYSIFESLPLLEETACLRPKDSILDRLLTLHTVIACSFKFGRQKGIAWLEQEQLSNCLTSTERHFLANNEEGSVYFQNQVEGLWILAWSLGLVDKLDFSKCCADDFVKIFPNMKCNESSQSFRSRARPRSIEEVFAACDLAYCLHWAIRQADLDGAPPPGKIDPVVIIERRRALEWLLSDEEWDEIALDT